MNTKKSKVKDITELIAVLGHDPSGLEPDRVLHHGLKSGEYQRTYFSYFPYRDKHFMYDYDNWSESEQRREALMWKMRLAQARRNKFFVALYCTLYYIPMLAMAIIAHFTVWVCFPDWYWFFAIPAACVTGAVITPVYNWFKWLRPINPNAIYIKGTFRRESLA